MIFFSICFWTVWHLEHLEVAWSCNVLRMNQRPSWMTCIPWCPTSLESVPCHWEGEKCCRIWPSWLCFVGEPVGKTSMTSPMSEVLCVRQICTLVALVQLGNQPGGLLKRVGFHWTLALRRCRMISKWIGFFCIYHFMYELVRRKMVQGM